LKTVDIKEILLSNYCQQNMTDVKNIHCEYSDNHKLVVILHLKQFL
jgi:hypothetical protein